MLQIFEDIEDVVDDLLIWGESAQQHDSRLMQVFNKARKWNLKLNKQKCQIKKEKMSYIGHTFTKDGSRQDAKKTEVIINVPSPKNKEELQRYVSYLSKFIPNLSHIAAPLQNLLEKHVKWHW